MLILASNSIRRKELLEEKGFNVQVVHNEVNEKSVKITKRPREYVRRIALLKMRKYLATYFENEVVITADTIVVLNNEYIGKPSNEEDTIRIVNMLNNKWHEVYTGVAVHYRNKKYTITEKSKVKFRNLSNQEIRNYSKTTFWHGKAGAYGIQDPNSLVEKHEGDLNNIIGLPVDKLIKLLKKINAI